MYDAIGDIKLIWCQFSSVTKLRLHLQLSPDFVWDQDSPVYELAYSNKSQSMLITNTT